MPGTRNSDLQENYKRATEKELVHIIMNPHEYEREAKSLAEREIKNRNIPDERIQELKGLLIREEEDRAEKQEKHRSRLKVVVDKFNKFYDLIGPTKESKPVEKVIFIIAIFYLVTFLRYFYYNLSFFFYHIKDAPIDITLFMMLGALVVDIAIIYGLLLKKKIGWLLTTSYFCYSILFLLSLWFNELQQERLNSSGGILDFVDRIVIRGNAYYITNLIFYIALISYFLSDSVRNLFKIKSLHIAYSLILGSCLAVSQLLFVFLN